MIGASSPTAQDRIRASGYSDGVRGWEDRSRLYHPADRFAYQAGRRDGEAARSKPCRPMHPADIMCVWDPAANWAAICIGL